jgi:phosphatidylglycerol lysyltransferase
MTLIDTLRAFARGSLVAFGVRSLLRHPSGLPWALALPLPAWTLALAWLAATRRASLLGFPPFELALWVAFDALMLLVLVRVAMQPRRSRLLVATSFAMGDALLSLGHLAWVGLGYSPLQLALRSAAALAPTAGALLLAWATTRAA